MYSRATLNFSRALVSLAKERALLDGVLKAGQELVASLRVPELLKFMSHPKVPIQAKREIMQRLIPPESPVEFRNFINLIIDRRRADILAPILDAVIDEVMKAKGYEIVEIISALPLSAAEQEMIQSNLKKSWHVKIAIKYRQNPNLIGGIIVRRGDQFIDGSLAGRLNALKQFLIEEVSIPGLA